MEPAAFRDDLSSAPEHLSRLADSLAGGLPGVEGLDALRSGSRLLILGMGSSGYAAAQPARHARAQGASVWVESASAADLPEPADDLTVIAVSATGGSVEVLAAIERYAGSERLVGITNRPDSPLGRAADVVLTLDAGVERSGVACRTFRATGPVLDVALSRLAGTRPFFTPAQVGRAAEANAQLLGRHDWLEPLVDLLDGPQGAWALAPLERLASAQQSALMMREVPRRPVFSSETGEWSHVDVYLTKTQDYRAVCFAGSAWDQPALDWMDQRGSRYAAVGAELPGAEFAIRFPGDDDARVALLSEVLVGELVAAHWLGADG